MRCEVEGCHNDATVAPCLRVPALGYSLDAHQPASMIFGVHVCLRHYEKDWAGGMIQDRGNEEMREVVELALRASSRAPPDWDRACFVPMKLDSPEFAMFERMRSKPS